MYLQNADESIKSLHPGSVPVSNKCSIGEKIKYLLKFPIEKKATNSQVNYLLKGLHEVLPDLHLPIFIKH